MAAQERIHLPPPPAVIPADLLIGVAELAAAEQKLALRWAAGELGQQSVAGAIAVELAGEGHRWPLAVEADLARRIADHPGPGEINRPGRPGCGEAGQHTKPNAQQEGPGEPLDLEASGRTVHAGVDVLSGS